MIDSGADPLGRRLAAIDPEFGDALSVGERRWLKVAQSCADHGHY
jgi:hypothetical protein